MPDRSRHRLATLAGLTGLGLSGLCLTACQAERPLAAAAEPTWTYRDSDTQLSNNDEWQRMVPDDTLTGLSEARVVSVEAMRE